MRQDIAAILKQLAEEPRVIVLKPNHRRLADEGERVKEQVKRVRERLDAVPGPEPGGGRRQRR